MNEFGLQRFLDLSGPVKLEDLDWDQAVRHGITAGEARMLRYMADTESHTILYLRDLLAGHSARDPEITAFLSVWVYEEFWHGRAIDRFLTAAGYPPAPDHYTTVTQGSALKELFEAVLSQLAASITRRFAATHMTWGAINELTAAAAYQALERHTANPVLATLCNRMAKQERKHFSFYYHQAAKRLEKDGMAQRICRFALKAFWDPVGSGVAGDETGEYMAATLFPDAASRHALSEADRLIAELPGMSWFRMIEPAVEKRARTYERNHGSDAFRAAIAR